MESMHAVFHRLVVLEGSVTKVQARMRTVEKGAQYI